MRREKNKSEREKERLEDIAASYPLSMSRAVLL